VTKAKRPWRPREAIEAERTLREIRTKLDDPKWADIFRGLPLHPGVRLDPLKDKIAETLIALITQPSEFRSERLLREECDRYAEKLRKFLFLPRNSERRRPLRKQIKAWRKILERRAVGTERPGLKLPLLQADGSVRLGPVEIREYLLREQTDHRHVYDIAVLSLFAILRHVTRERGRTQLLLFQKIAYILQAVGVLPDDDEDHTEAVKRRFNRGNRPPDGIASPSPVDFLEHELFAIDKRFPPRPSVLPPKFHSTSIATPAPPSPKATRRR